MMTFTINAALISLAACTLCVRAVSQQGLGPPTKDSGSIEIPFPEMVEHFVSGSRVIHCSGPSERIPLRIVVTPEGNRGDAYVRYCGDLRGQVSTRVIRQLVQMFSAADYFNLFDRYAMSATDLPTYTTSISFDEKSKSVIDYDGLWVGMPEAVMDIEDSVDRLAGPKVWAKEIDAKGDLYHPCPR